MSPPESATIRFLLDGEVVTVTGLPPATTVLEYLRTVAGRTGTKEGCAEGDCGACTVVVGELSADGSAIEYRSINSCIRFLPTLDGKELVTVESLSACLSPCQKTNQSASDNRLHPVQQAMVDRHASQCGFCTPGFVMSLLALYLNKPAATREDVLEALSGNLCRCTGYRPIIEAGCHLQDYPQPTRWSREDSQSQERLAVLRSLRRPNGDPALSLAGFRVPRGLDELAGMLEEAPESLLLAGGTDIGLWVTKHLRELPPIIYLGEVRELKQISATPAGLRIGAGVPLSSAWPALVADHPGLAEQARRFASPPICNSGTLGGNIANGSPIGDSMPALIALGAQIELRRGSRVRHLPLEQFYLGYQKKDLAPGEFVVAVTVPPPRPGCLFASYKLAKRHDQDISAVCAAYAVDVANGTVLGARLAYGGMAEIPARALNAEQALIGRPWSEDSVQAAMAALGKDFRPLTDARGSSEYRLRTAANLLRRFYLQHSGSVGAVRISDRAVEVDRVP